MTEFIDCTSLQISYDIMGIATVTYTVVHDIREMVVYNTISAGGQRFTGFVADAALNPVPKTGGWYETTVTLMATTN